MSEHRPPSLVGRRIGPYVIRAELGHGGMGAVYRVRHAETRAQYALKVFFRRPTRGDPIQATLEARFRREAQILARIDGHPNIIRVFSFGAERDLLFCVMELVVGSDLAGHLEKGPMAPKRAARIVAACARATHHVHRFGVYHRDIKPSNILMDDAGNPRILDFGLALDDQAARLTASDLTVGTPVFMAPEQINPKLAGAEIGPYTDVYGLGGTLYTCLAARLPFEGADSRTTMTRVLSTPPIPPSRHVPNVPPALEAICLRAMEKRPSDRPPTAEALAEELERWLRGDEVVSRRPGRMTRAARVVGTTSRRARVAFAILMLSLALAALAGVPMVAAWFGGRGALTGLDRVEAALDRGERPSPADVAAIAPLLDLAPDADADARALTERAHRVVVLAGAGTDLRSSRRGSAAHRLQTLVALLESGGGDLSVASELGVIADVLADDRERHRRALVLERVARVELEADGQWSEEDVHRIADLVRPDGQIDAPLAVAAQALLHGRGSLGALNGLCHARNPIVTCDRRFAGDLARAIAYGEGDPRLAAPVDSAAFGALAQADGLDDATRGRLLLRHGAAALDRGVDAHRKVLAAYLIAFDERGLIAGPEGWPPALHGSALRRLLDEARQSPASARDLCDLLARAPGRPDVLEGSLIADLQNVLMGETAGFSIDRPLSPGEAVELLPLAATLERYGLLPTQLNRGRPFVAALGLDRIVELGEDEMERRSEARNPAVLLFLARAYLGSVKRVKGKWPEKVARILDGKLERWLDAVIDAGLEEAWVQLQLGLYRWSLGQPEASGERLERALELDRALDDVQRWPVIPMQLALVRLDPRRSRAGGVYDAHQGAVAALEGVRLQNATLPLLQEVRDASGIPPYPIAQWLNAIFRIHQAANHLVYLDGAGDLDVGADPRPTEESAADPSELVCCGRVRGVPGVEELVAAGFHLFDHPMVKHTVTLGAEENWFCIAILHEARGRHHLRHDRIEEALDAFDTARRAVEATSPRAPRSKKGRAAELAGIERFRALILEELGRADEAREAAAAAKKHASQAK